MIAVDPDRQRAGIATALTRTATQWMRDSGMSAAMVETGGDPGHLPARRIYETTGFTPLPVSRLRRGFCIHVREASASRLDRDESRQQDAAASRWFNASLVAAERARQFGRARPLRGSDVMLVSGESHLRYRGSGR